tara:strand:+ start:394 stop:999 length:606 start_codon:yes stop_codon:yes gene_type:complete
MILPIAHRINSLEDARSLPKTVGVEFDVHAYGKDLIVAHDPFSQGIKLNKFLEFNKNRLCAINIKEEGIEREVIQLSQSLGVKDFFLFDVNFPQVFRLGNLYKKHLCIRLSEFEKPKLSELKNYCSYLWIDTFKGEFWMSEKELIHAKSLEYNLCFVSPELHVPNIKKQIQFSKKINDNITLLDEKDVVCTKDYKIYSTYW